MHTQHLFFPSREMARQRHQELLREAEHVRLMRRLRPRRNTLARRLAEALNRVVAPAHTLPPVRDLETA
jgi:hypothetical protein